MKVLFVTLVAVVSTIAIMTPYNLDAQLDEKLEELVSLLNVAKTDSLAHTERITEFIKEGNEHLVETDAAVDVLTEMFGHKKCQCFANGSQYEAFCERGRFRTDRKGCMS